MENMSQGKPRGGNGKFVRSVDTAERDAQAARMRSQGLGLAEIAAALGFANAGGAYKAVDRALKAIPAEAVAELRMLETARLDALTREAWAIASRRHPHVTPGGRIAVGPDGEEVRNDAPVLAALGLLLKIAERRARQLGLDAARKYEVESRHITLDAIDAEIARMRAEIAALPEAAAPVGDWR